MRLLLYCSGMTFSKVAIIGPGLLGGSIALALRARFPSTQVSVWGRRAEALNEIRPVVSLASTDLGSVVSGAELVVLCVPVGFMAEITSAFLSHLGPQTIVTDVGSVKAPVVAALSAILKGRARFVGSHPMAGSERTGFAAAKAELFQESVCILTPDAEAEPTTLSAVAEFWRSLGCSTHCMTPELHDQTVALVSHLPHLLAATLVGLVHERDSQAMQFCGPGFRDTTRVASGPAKMWAEIFASNSLALKHSAEAMIEKLQQMVKLIEQPERMEAFLSDAKAARDQIRITQ